MGLVKQIRQSKKEDKEFRGRQALESGHLSYDAEVVIKEKMSQYFLEQVLSLSSTPLDSGNVSSSANAFLTPSAQPTQQQNTEESAIF